MIRNLFIFLAFITAIDAAYSQSIISGKVTSEAGEALIGANVYIANTYDGANSGVDGSYSFGTEVSGTITLIVSYVGFEKAEKSISLKGDEEVNFQLKEAFSAMEAVTISAGTFEASDKKKVVVLQSLDIATTAGATADITGALNTLPGTQTVGESGRLFVRGGTAEETKIFIDGAEAPHFYGTTANNIPTRSRFSPFLFKGTFFSTGGFSAEYGQALSSALILNTLDVDPDSKVELSLMSVGLEAGVTRSWEDQSLYARMGYTNLNPYNNLIDQRMNWRKGVVSWDGTLAHKLRMKNGGMIKTLAMGNQSDMAFSRQTVLTGSGVEDVAINNRNVFGTTSLNYPIGESDHLYVGLSAGHNVDDLVYNNSGITQSQNELHTKAKFIHEFNPKTILNTGTEIFYEDHAESIVDSLQPLSLGFQNHTAAYYSELDQYLSKKWVLRAGLRAEHVELLNSFQLSPRFSMAWKLSESAQISMASGLYYQQPESRYLLRTKNLRQEKAAHYIFNYQQVREGKVIRVEAYLKDYRKLITYDELNQPATYANDGEGYAYGLDVFWRNRGGIQNLDYWVSYSWMKSERLFRDFPVKAAPGFSSAHNFSVVAKRFFPLIRSQVGVTYAFTSGRPYENPNLKGFNESTTKPYHDLSFNIAFLPTANVVIYFSATNVPGFDQVFGYNYAPHRDENGNYASETVRLPAKRFLFLGCFITIGAFDRQLNNL